MRNPDIKLDTLTSISFDNKGRCKAALRQPDGREISIRRIVGSYYLGGQEFMIVSSKVVKGADHKIPLLVRAADRQVANFLLDRFVLDQKAG